MVRKKILNVLALVGLAFTFASWGVADFVSSASTGEVVATIGKNTIGLPMLEQELDRFREYARRERPEATEEQLRSPEIIRQNLEDMVQQRLVAQYLTDAHLLPSNDRLASVIAAQAEFTENGVFSPERYKTVIRQSRQSIEGFEENTRLSIAKGAVFPQFFQTTIFSPESLSLWHNIIGETREVLPHRIVGAKFTNQVAITEDEIKAYYNNNKTALQEPAKVRMKFVDFSELTLADAVSVDETKLQELYQTLSQTGQFDESEKRVARHILIAAKADAPDNIKAEAKKRLEDIAKKARATPHKFAELAKQYSEDTGSKASGGHLGEVVTGMMVAPFDKALFALTPTKNISDIVETQFGYHLIKLEKILPAKKKTFEEAKDEVIAQYKQNEAKNLFNAFSENFTELIEQHKNDADGLEKLAEMKPLNLKVQQTPQWIDASTTVFPFNDPALLKVALSPEATEKKHIIKAVAKNTKRILALQVIDYQKPADRSLEQVRSDIEKTLKQNKIAELVAKEANETLQALKAGKDDLLWERPIEINRVEPVLGRENTEAIFALPPSPLPTYYKTAASGANGQQITIYKLVKVGINPQAIAHNKEEVDGLYKRYWDGVENKIIINALKEKYKVTINEKPLEKLSKAKVE